MSGIYIKELKSYFSSMTTYIFFFLFLLTGGYAFTHRALIEGSSQMAGFFSDISIVMMGLVPLLTMKLFWADRRSGVMKQLLASRLTAGKIVLGKYFAALTVLATALGATLVYVLILAIFAYPSAAEILICYAGFALFSAALISIGVFLSALTTRIVTAATSTFGSLFCIWSISAILPSMSSGLLRSVLEFFSVYTRFRRWLMGIISLSGAVYFISVAVVFLLVASAVFEYSRRHHRR